MRYQVFQSVLSALGVSLNALLIFLAIKKTPVSMRPCSIIIGIKSTTDVAVALTNYFVTERLISTGDMILIVSEGRCSDFTKLTCFSGHMLLTSFMQQNLIWLIVSYIFRYYIIHYRNPSLKTFVVTTIVCYTPSLLHSLIWINTFFEFSQDEVAPRILSKPDDMVLSGWVVRQSTEVVLGILTASSTMVFVFYLWIIHNLTKFLKENTSRLSRSAVILNKQLVKTAHFQSSIPINILLGVAAFLTMHFSILDPINVQFLPSTFFVLTTIVSPISYILFLPPYWNFCFGEPKRQAVRRLKARLRMNATVTNGIIDISISTRSSPMSIF